MQHTSSRTLLRRFRRTPTHFNYREFPRVDQGSIAILFSFLIFRPLDHGRNPGVPNVLETRLPKSSAGSGQAADSNTSRSLDENQFPMLHQLYRITHIRCPDRGVNRTFGRTPRCVTDNEVSGTDCSVSA